MTITHGERVAPLASHSNLHAKGSNTVSPEMKALSLQLTAPFAADAVHWKPLAVKGERALAAAYLDARAVMQRLDTVFGVGGWKDTYEIVNGGSVVCTLSVLVDDRWVEKTDVGSPSEQPDDGDKLKAAFSDALKRAAVKLGVGRYLYRLPRLWVEYDAQRRQFVRPPTLPPWALPSIKASA